ncbi:hypothetical protein [Actinomadura sp. 6K520]|uniref:hypothetical protein n=1 Tax=Actinomadura sp. 6K520 TaxID=2530364 RepID=UPI001FB7807E|nr:hypothetical protein [Actinomadura sp. 6K520]
MFKQLEAMTPGRIDLGMGRATASPLLDLHRRRGTAVGELPQGLLRRYSIPRVTTPSSAAMSVMPAMARLCGADRFDEHCGVSLSMAGIVGQGVSPRGMFIDSGVLCS